MFYSLPLQRRGINDGAPTRSDNSQQAAVHPRRNTLHSGTWDRLGAVDPKDL